MTCEEFLKRLDEDRAEGDTSFAAHENECTACRAAKVQWEEARKEFAAMAEEDAPPFLHTRVMAHVREAERDSGSRSLLARLLFRNRWATSLAALFIGAILGGVGVWQILRPGYSYTSQLPSPASRSMDGLALDEAKSQLVQPAEAKKAEDQAAVAPASTPEKPAPRPPAPAGSLFQRKGAASDPGPSADEEQASGLSVGEIRMKSSADPGAPGPSRAPAHPTNEPVGQEREALAMAPRAEAVPADAALVVCMIRPEGGGATKVVQIPADSAPSPGVLWTMVIQRGGAFYLLDAGGKPIKPDMGLVNELAGLDLSPGRYVVRRVG